MSAQHKDLAAGRWGQMLFVEQMANIGSEVERALNWRMKSNIPYSERASERALELMDLTLEAATTFSRRREVARIREAFVDYFFGSNDFKSTDTSWKKYFYHFTYAARRNVL